MNKINSLMYAGRVLLGQISGGAVIIFVLFCFAVLQGASGADEYEVMVIRFIMAVTGLVLSGFFIFYVVHSVVRFFKMYKQKEKASETDLSTYNQMFQSALSTLPVIGLFSLLFFWKRIRTISKEVRKREVDRLFLEIDVSFVVSTEYVIKTLKKGINQLSEEERQRELPGRLPPIIEQIIRRQEERVEKFAGQWILLVTRDEKTLNFINENGRELPVGLKDAWLKDLSSSEVTSLEVLREGIEEAYIQIQRMHEYKERPIEKTNKTITDIFQDYHIEPPEL